MDYVSEAIQGNARSFIQGNARSFIDRQYKDLNKIGKFNALLYLSAIAITGKTVDYVLNNNDFAEKFKNDAIELGIVASDGTVSKSTQSALKEFFADKEKVHKISKMHPLIIDGYLEEINSRLSKSEKFESSTFAGQPHIL